MILRTTFLILAAIASAPCFAQASKLPFDKCFESASTRYSVDKRMLVAIAQTESRMNPNAIGPKNANGTHDIGMMQVNSTWLPTLAKYGIKRSDLMAACTNIHVGAWILADNISRHGQTWKAVGAYNAATASKQVTYAAKVRDNYALVGPLVQ